MAEQTYTGTWEQLMALAPQFAGRVLRLTVLSDTEDENASGSMDAAGQATVLIDGGGVPDDAPKDAAFAMYRAMADDEDAREADESWMEATVEDTSATTPNIKRQQGA